MVGSSNESASTSSRVPLFDKSNFGFWKDRMRAHMDSEEFGLLKVIDDGEYVVERFKTSGETKVERNLKIFLKKRKGRFN
ncbi:hypothetical protein LIER_18477 [Lithospermum erythrorhizon]|uniref:Uncharacterized protein n=1 Tax=Lithospermum erythrorhizon TaxID=34254 RepID=A0AAV3QJK0_LITER